MSDFSDISLVIISDALQCAQDTEEVSEVLNELDKIPREQARGIMRLLLVANWERVGILSAQIDSRDHDIRDLKIVNANLLARQSRTRSRLLELME